MANGVATHVYRHQDVMRERQMMKGEVHYPPLSPLEEYVMWSMGADGQRGVAPLLAPCQRLMWNMGLEGKRCISLSCNIILSIILFYRVIDARSSQ